MQIDISKALFERAKKVIPGGVNSPVRAFRSVGGTPRFIKSAKGSRIKDEDGNIYIDYVTSWGPALFGHCDNDIIESVRSSALDGLSFGAPTEREVIMAEYISKAVPSIELVRMVSSGTEAVMSAIRVARGYTGRDKIVKFEGCYHGHADSMLVNAGSGLLTFGVPNSQGVPEDFAKHTLTLRYNDINGLCELMDKMGDQIAAIILEPVAANMGVVLPNADFLKALRDKTKEKGALLIFDEVITGFRISLQGAQGYYGITPDLTTFGKIIGGGMPVGAYGGKKEIMECVSPLGGVYQAGTLSGNPVAMAAGIATMEKLFKDDKFYDKLALSTKRLADGLKKAAENACACVQIPSVCGLCGIYFTDKEVVDYDCVKSASADKYKIFFNSMLNQGIYIAPSAFEALFVSSAHSNEDIDITIAAAQKAFEEVVKA